MLTITLADTTIAKDKRVNNKNNTRMMRRNKINPYGLRSIGNNSQAPISKKND